MVMETCPVFLISVACTKAGAGDASTCSGGARRGGLKDLAVFDCNLTLADSAVCVCSERTLPEDFLSHGCAQQGGSVASGVAVGHYLPFPKGCTGVILIW